jgi:hypothetical protein
MDVHDSLQDAADLGTEAKNLANNLQDENRKAFPDGSSCLPNMLERSPHWKRWNGRMVSTRSMQPTKAATYKSTCTLFHNRLCTPGNQGTTKKMMMEIRLLLAKFLKTLMRSKAVGRSQDGGTHNHPGIVVVDNVLSAQHWQLYKRYFSSRQSGIEDENTQFGGICWDIYRRYARSYPTWTWPVGA